MQFNPEITELTTAATDAAIALIAILIVLVLQRRRADYPLKVGLWSLIFGLLAIGSALGAVVHGFVLPEKVWLGLWQPLYLSLGITVALFVVGAVYDWSGERLARRLLLPAVIGGVLFYGMMVVLGGAFLFFVLYEALAMATALVLYLLVWARKTLPGAWLMAAGVGLTMAAAAVQASDLALTIIWPIDHNGLFHLVQIAAMLVLAAGLLAGTGEPQRTGSHRPVS
ncbi:MAG: hypothetical protein ABFS14_11845 [Gemmatimonadota bacterium]